MCCVSESGESGKGLKEWWKLCGIGNRGVQSLGAMQKKCGIRRNEQYERRIEIGKETFPSPN